MRPWGCMSNAAPMRPPGSADGRRAPPSASTLADVEHFTARSRSQRLAGRLRPIHSPQLDFLSQAPHICIIERRRPGPAVRTGSSLQGKGAMANPLRFREHIAPKREGRASAEASVPDVLAALDPSRALTPRRRNGVSRIMTLLSRFEATLPGEASK
ncbi:MAG: hypothetical protein PWQ57_114 [Desulfovibrionales bacterium]|nr:hypothetical protein [Desulfovibrionales bacterium]